MAQYYFKFDTISTRPKNLIPTQKHYTTARNAFNNYNHSKQKGYILVQECPNLGGKT